MTDTAQPNPAPLTPAEIDAIAEREARTTVGPWVHEDTFGFRDTAIRNPNGLGVLLIVPEFANRRAANAAFVCAMRSDVPRLLATVRHLQDQLAYSDQHVALYRDACEQTRIESDRRYVALANDVAQKDMELARLRAALTDIATPRPYVDMADPDDEQQRDALSALCRLHEVARKALDVLGDAGGR